MYIKLPHQPFYLLQFELLSSSSVLQIYIELSLMVIFCSKLNCTGLNFIVMHKTLMVVSA